jgi:hypothetical protein
MDVLLYKFLSRLTEVISLMCICNICDSSHGRASGYPDWCFSWHLSTTTRWNLTFSALKRPQPPSSNCKYLSFLHIFFDIEQSLPSVQFQEITHKSGMFIAGFALMFQKLWRLQGHSSEIKWKITMSLTSTATVANTWTSCQQKVSICNSKIKTESMIPINRCMIIVSWY